MLRLALLSALLADVPVDSTAAAAETAATDDRASVAGGWLRVSPLGVGVPGPGRGSDIAVLRQAVVAGYRWGFSAGFTLEPRPRLLLNLAGGFDQTIWSFRNRDSYRLCFAGDCYGWTERGLGHLMRLGLELRLGFADRWWMAWALAGAHVGVSRLRLDCENSREDHCDRHETDVGPGLGGGVGVALRMTSRAALGFEAGVEHTWLDRRDDPFMAARAWDLAMILALRF